MVQKCLGSNVWCEQPTHRADQMGDFKKGSEDVRVDKRRIKDPVHVRVHPACQEGVP